MSTDLMVYDSDRERSDVRARLPGDSPRDRIISVATHLFAEQGCNGTSMRDIAKAVGMLPGSLYTHIASKDALVGEIIENGIDCFNQAVAEVDARRYPPLLAFREAIHAHVKVVADNPERARIVFQQWRFIQRDNRASLRNKLSRYADFFRCTLARGVEKGIFGEQLDPAGNLRLVLAALAWAPDWLSDIGRERSDEVAEQIIEALTHGVLSRVIPECELTTQHELERVSPSWTIGQVCRGE